MLFAVEEAQRYAPTPEEQKWIDRIEAVRTRLEHSDRVLRTPRHEYTGDIAHKEVFEDTVGELCSRGSKPRDAAIFLFGLLRHLRPARAIELGTLLGISAAYQAAALELNGTGRLTTIEAAAARAELAREVLGELSLSDVADSRNGRFQDVVPVVLQEGPVEYAFVDGHHEEQATIDYVELIEQDLVPPGVIVIDDIAWSDGMANAWAAIRSREDVKDSAEVLGMGVCVYW